MDPPEIDPSPRRSARLGSFPVATPPPAPTLCKLKRAHEPPPPPAPSPETPVELPIQTERALRATKRHRLSAPDPSPTLPLNATLRRSPRTGLGPSTSETPAARRPRAFSSATPSVTASSQDATNTSPRNRSPAKRGARVHPPIPAPPLPALPPLTLTTTIDTQNPRRISPRCPHPPPVSAPSKRKRGPAFSLRVDGEASLSADRSSFSSAIGKRKGRGKPKAKGRASEQELDVFMDVDGTATPEEIITPIPILTPSSAPVEDAKSIPLRECWEYERERREHQSGDLPPHDYAYSYPYEAQHQAPPQPQYQPHVEHGSQVLQLQQHQHQGMQLQQHHQSPQHGQQQSSQYQQQQPQYQQQQPQQQQQQVQEQQASRHTRDGFMPWKTACRLRVEYLKRHYSPLTIRHLVAQQAAQYFLKHGYPKPWRVRRASCSSASSSASAASPDPVGNHPSDSEIEVDGSLGARVRDDDQIPDRI
ncbi:hypothetical protein C0991_001326 [Blastosporella zonata]|nr:hypothetical protein C0991_001326 [Blastosporella zonata]